ncbi:oligosaccharide flippase family protein [Ruminococcus sp. JE7B6]|uniref:oligosaccharide flippase family protein n=1 Tax=Ruminococcus sp. JE7B6 TaxID=3233380 RepID=UPI00389A02B7
MAKSQLRVGAVMSYINMALGSLIPMFYTPVMLNLLGQSEYGLFKLASTVTSYLGLISFGIGSAVVRYLVKYRAEGDKDGEERMFGLFNIIFLVLSAITLVVGVVIAFNVGLIYGQSLSNEQLFEMTILVLILTINTAICFSATPYTAVVTCHERFIFLQIINIITTVLTPIANLFVLFLGFKSIGMVASSFALTIVIRIVYIIYVKSSIGIKPRYKNMPTYLVKELLIFSFWIFVSNVVNQLYNATDTVIIGAVPALATVGVAIYNVGATFTNMMQSFTTGINSVLTPKINTMVFTGSSNAELTDMVIRFGRLQAYIVALVCSGFIAFGQQFIKLWAGSDYSEAYWVCLATMIPICIPLVQSVALNIIVAQNRHRFRSLVYLGIAIVNVIGTILCVNQFGIIGAAVVSGVAYIIGPGLILNWYYWKKIGLEIPRFWKEIVKLFIIPTIIAAVTIFILNFVTLDKWITLLIGIIIYTLVFAIVNWFIVMNDYEKDIFRGPVLKIVRKFRRKKA